jgi:hypothetical protein
MKMLIGNKLKREGGRSIGIIWNGKLNVENNEKAFQS